MIDLLIISPSNTLRWVWVWMRVFHVFVCVAKREKCKFLAERVCNGERVFVRCAADNISISNAEESLI